MEGVNQANQLNAGGEVQTLMERGKEKNEGLMERERR